MSGLQEWIGKEKFEIRNKLECLKTKKARDGMISTSVRFGSPGMCGAFTYMKSAGQAWVASPFRKGEGEGEGLPLEPPSPPELEPLTLVLSPSPGGEAAERTEVCRALCRLNNAQRRSLQLSYSWNGSSLLRGLLSLSFCPSCLN